jgi:hypothetical protein
LEPPCSPSSCDRVIGTHTIALADARTAIAVARDDLPAILAAAADTVADPCLLGRLEPGRMSF